MEFPRVESWSWLPFPSSGDIPDPRIGPGSPALQADSKPRFDLSPEIFFFKEAFSLGPSDTSEGTDRKSPRSCFGHALGKQEEIPGGCMELGRRERSGWET